MRPLPAMARTLAWCDDLDASCEGQLNKHGSFEFIEYNPDNYIDTFSGSPPKREASFDSLPNELCLRIFRYFDPVRDRLPVLALVCRKWHHLLRTTTSLWRQLYVDPTFYAYSHFSVLMSIFRIYGEHIQQLTWKDNAPVYEPLFALISKLEHLRVLRLPVLWTRAVVESLAPLSHLERVDIHGGFSFSDEELLMIGAQFPRLKVLSLNACWSLTTNGFRQWLHQMPSLTTLKLKINSNLRLTDFRSEAAMAEGLGIVSVVAEAPKASIVTVLCLHFVPIEMEQLWGIVNKLTALRKITVSNCENLQAIRIDSSSLQKIYLYNLWSALFVSITADSLRMMTIDHGLESMEHLTIEAPKLRKIHVDGSQVLRTIQIRSERLVVMEIYHCDQLEISSLRETLTYNKSVACLKLGRLSEENISFDENCCPAIQELCLRSDFACNALHIRSPTLRLIHTQADIDLDSLNHLYVIANHLCKVSLVGVPALRNLVIQCVSVDAVELNLCSDEQLCLESFVIQALTSIGFLRLFDCRVNLLCVNTPLARTVVLYRCHMTDYVLQMALTGCPNIAHLNLEKCTSLTRVNLQAQPMKYLNLFGCADMDRVDLDCPKMVGINLGHCPNVRLFISGIEKDLTRESDEPEIVLPSQSIRWSHDFPPQSYECR